MKMQRRCTVCLMDETASDIVFDATGQCNFCRDFQAALASMPSLEERDARRSALVRQVRNAGRGKRYDCIVGVSGGADSSYSLWLAVNEGLRPLAVHLDNGWNSELASHNIATLVSRLNVDLMTHVIDWEENRDLQRSFFAADVIDIELLMDSAMLATNFRAARRFGVKYILSGSNQVTEGMRMPTGWNHSKYDAANARAIHRRHGHVPIRTHPLYDTTQFLLDRYLRRIRWISFLDYFEYDKASAAAFLKNELGYKPYPYKHYESVFTRFYQGYILPIKFGVDKRKLHLSALVVSGQMRRDEALDMLEKDTYPDLQQKRDDRYFVLKKLGFSEAEFDAYMTRSPVPHSAYPSELDRLAKLSRARKSLHRALRWSTPLSI
jgi:N-acetyl sugar amidotransferase